MLYEISKLGVGLLAAVAVLVLTQDFQIFPGLFSSVFSSSDHKPNSEPAGYESFFIRDEQGTEIEVWRRAAASSRSREKRSAAIIFHGNGGPLPYFSDLQELFYDAGVTSYQMDYRGYGRSQGWPSEAKISADAERLLLEVSKREELPANNLIVLGQSIGSGFAAGLAAKHRVRALVLLSPYISLPALAAENPILRMLTPLLWYQLPVQQNVASLGETALIIAHGRADSIIPFRHGKSVSEAYRGTGRRIEIFIDQAGHNDLFYRARTELEAAIKQIL